MLLSNHTMGSMGLLPTAKNVFKNIIITSNNTAILKAPYCSRSHYTMPKTASKRTSAIYVSNFGKSGTNGSLKKSIPSLLMAPTVSAAAIIILLLLLFISTVIIKHTRFKSWTHGYSHLPEFCIAAQIKSLHDKTVQCRQTSVYSDAGHKTVPDVKA